MNRRSFLSLLAYGWNWPIVGWWIRRYFFRLWIREAEACARAMIPGMQRLCAELDRMGLIFEKMGDEPT